MNNTCSLSAGTTRSLLLILKYLHRGYSLDVAARPDSDGLPAALFENEIPFHPLGFLPFASFRRMVRLIRGREYDLVYANGLGNVTRESFWAAKLTRRPFVWHIREPLRFRRSAWTVRFSDAVAANSHYTAQRVISVAGFQTPAVIPNGIEPNQPGVDRARTREALLQELRWPADSFLMLNLGWLCARKNQMDAIETARLVTERYPEARLVCLGAPAEDGYAEALKERISRDGLSEKVRLLGFKPNPSDYLQCADLLLHTAVREPQGRAALEAMAARLPVVAYGVGGLPEAVLDDETGFLVPVGDVAAAAEAVGRLIADPERRRRMGEAGYARVMQHFTAEATARLVDDLIQTVLARRPQAGTNDRPT